MACFHPLLAVDNGVDYSGKHRVKILGKRVDFNLETLRSRYGDSLMMLPCGHCVACAQDYARTWQLRIMAESTYHLKSCFITLTYRDAPPEPSKEDARKFIKAVRNKYGPGIKFFCAGEKGTQSGRSHLHLILFGVDFAEDRVEMTKRGTNMIFGSKTLDELWEYKGWTSIGSVDVASAGYVSQYCNKKKISGQDDGEFVIMSRGLGRRYFEDNKDKIFDSDFLYFDGNKFKFPRYFLKLAHEADFYIQVLAMDYSDRKRYVAQNFRYDTCRSVNYEEEGMKQAESAALHKLHHKEGDVRDVI